MAITGCFDGSLIPLSKTRRRALALAPAPNLRFPAVLRSNRASLTPPPTANDDPGPREIPLALALLLSAAVAAAAVPHAAIAASGGSMGGRSSSRSSSSTSRSSSSRSSSSRSTSSSSSSTSNWLDSSNTHESVGTAAPPPPVTMEDITLVMQVFIGLIFLALAVWHYNRPRITVVKLQVALLGLAKPFQKELNEIAEKVEASNQRWYKFILTETVFSLSLRNDCCISSSLSVDVKVGEDSWDEHFDKVAIEERNKFDAETLCNLDRSRGRKNTPKKQMASETNI